MDPELHSISSVVLRADERARTGHAATTVWPTGFELLDLSLDGGFRSGNLVLMAGPQGQGKTTFALQVARNIAKAGHQVAYFCYEHEPQVLLERLVAMEGGEVGGDDGPSLSAVRRAFEETESTDGGMVERLAGIKFGAEALERVLAYADNLHIHRSTGSVTTIGVISSACDDITKATGRAPVVVVDYLQKVKVLDASPVEDERVTVVVEDLKDLAIEHKVPVVAITAADKTGLATGKRMRARHLRGSTALAYEADVMLMLNNKFDVVSRQHLMYGVGNAERFREWSVVTIEKNRHGKAGVDLEFHQHFSHGRFDPHGRAVTEQLIDERMVLE